MFVLGGVVKGVGCYGKQVDGVVIKVVNFIKQIIRSKVGIVVWIKFFDKVFVEYNGGNIVLYCNCGVVLVLIVVVIFQAKGNCIGVEVIVVKSVFGNVMFINVVGVKGSIVYIFGCDGCQVFFIQVNCYVFVVGCGCYSIDNLNGC